MDLIKLNYILVTLFSLTILFPPTVSMYVTDVVIDCITTCLNGLPKSKGD